MNNWDDVFWFLEKDYFKKGDKRKLEKKLSSDSFFGLLNWGLFAPNVDIRKLMR